MEACVFEHEFEKNKKAYLRFKKRTDINLLNLYHGKFRILWCLIISKVVNIMV